jgi:proline racemase
MALMHARGELPLGHVFVHESILGTCFEGKIVEEVADSTEDAVVPSIAGAAYVTGFNQLVVDPEDPLASGFAIPAATS